MLMSVMASRLRDTLGRIGPSGSPEDAGWREASAMDAQLLADLAQVIGPAARFRYPAGKVIMREGQRGVALYALLEGRVAIRIGDAVVEKLGPGGIFGEMSLVDRTPRLATRRGGDRLRAARDQPPHVPAPGEAQPEIRAPRC